MLRIILGNRAHRRPERDHLLLMNIQERRFGPHPGRPRGGVNGKNALPRVQEVSRVAADTKGGKSPALGMDVNLLQDATGLLIEDQHFPVVR